MNMYNLIKEILEILLKLMIIPILVTLFIIFFTIYIIFIVKTFFKISTFAIYEPSIQITLIIFILLSLFLRKWRKQINWWAIFLYGFIFSLIAYNVNIYFIEKRISNIATNKYNVSPSYLDIDFGINDEYRDPHAVIYKNKQSYYWSFQEDDFVLNTNPRLHL